MSTGEHDVEEGYGPDGRYLPKECVACRDDTQQRYGGCRQAVCQVHDACPNGCDDPVVQGIGNTSAAEALRYRRMSDNLLYYGDSLDVLPRTWPMRASISSTSTRLSIRTPVTTSCSPSATARRPLRKGVG
jgi:hypothetical protein